MRMTTISHHDWRAAWNSRGKNFLARTGLCAAATIFDLATSKHKSALGIAQTSGPGSSSVKHKSANANVCTGAHTGFAQLNEILGKLHSGWLYLIGGRPAMGNRGGRIKCSVPLDFQKEIGRFEDLRT